MQCTINISVWGFSIILSPIYTVTIFLLMNVFRVGFYLIQVSSCFVLCASWFCFPISPGNLRVTVSVSHEEWPLT